MSTVSILLRREGIPISPYSLLPGSTPIGETARFGNAEITYRLEGEVLTIILYRSITRARGLRNPFAEMKWFLDVIHRHAPQIKKLVTTAMQIEHTDGGRVPHPDRLMNFYRRYFKAEDDCCLDGQQWLKLEIPNLQDYPPRANQDG